MMGGSDACVIAGWLGLLTGAALSFLYSGVETGMYVVNKIRLDLRAEAGDRRARRLLAALHEPGVVLVVVLIGNSLANYLASAGVVLLLTGWGWGHAEWWALAILTPTVAILCELLPKNLFQRHGETLTYSLAGFLTFSRRLFAAMGLVGLSRGLISGILKLARRRLGPCESPLGGRIARILAEGSASGVLTHAQSIIAERVVNLGQFLLRDVMVPLDRAALLERSATVEQVRQALLAHGHARYGVYAGRRDNVVGVLSVYDALLDQTGAAPASHATVPLMLRHDMGVIEALVRLQQARQPMGFVQGDDGRCLGVVTAKDLVEEIVGELEEW